MSGRKKKLELVALVITFVFSIGIFCFALFWFNQEPTDGLPRTAITADYSFAKEVSKLPFAGATAFCLSPDGRFWIANGDGLVKLTRQGRIVEKVPAVSSLATLHLAQDTIYGALRNIVYKMDLSKGARMVKPLIVLEEGSLVTSLALSGDRLFVADCAKRRILAFSLAGKLLWQSKGERGFVIPSPYFALCADGEGGAWVVNPGKRRFEKYDKDGRYERLWQPHKEHKFIGCCNPSKMMVLPDGSVITLEKGMLRSRHFNPDGSLREVLIKAGAVLSKDFTFDLAVDDDGQVFVLVKHANLILKVR